ncbi:hypothetical protein DFR60_11851 [Hungatella effluvii]|uniref:Uncharacterized protein n=1 Tax=Hungatella effluvii TaxID=1096246 RepID=A0A2V3YAK3_9FIRM|nr:hypothetical protein [Hungatella effluvii]PXX48172.1 hypothetical protein DFR60_11851 [Hungatella effluvii]
MSGRFSENDKGDRGLFGLSVPDLMKITGDDRTRGDLALKNEGTEMEMDEWEGLTDQEEPYEYTLSEAEMFAFLGKKPNPADNLTGKVLLVRLPDKKVEGLTEIRKVFQPKASALPWMKKPYPCIIADRLNRIEALEMIDKTGVPDCLRFVCDTQRAAGKGYFSYEEVLLRYREESGGIQRSDFRNTDPVKVVDKESVVNRAKQECTILYTDTEVYDDIPGEMWMVLFYSKGMLGGDQEVYMDRNGITKLIVCGE